MACLFAYYKMFKRVAVINTAIFFLKCTGANLVNELYSFCLVNRQDKPCNKASVIKDAQNNRVVPLDSKQGYASITRFMPVNSQGKRKKLID